jgi:hypothetical protein
MKIHRHHIILVILILVFITNQVLEKWGIRVPFLYSYLDDLLVVPITLGIYHLVPKPAHQPHVHPLLFTLVCVLGYSFHFEWLMPMISTRYTADGWDVVAYGCGAVFYTWVMQPGQPAIPGLIKKHANKI